MTTLGYIGERLDLLIRQGATLGPFAVTVRNKDSSVVDLTGCSVRAHLRKKALDNLLVATFEVSILDASAGKFQFGMSDEATTVIPAGETLRDVTSQYVWDLELEDSLGRVLPLYYGDCKVFREVTRA